MVLLGEPVVDLNGDERQQPAAERLRVEPGVKAAHDAALFELADALVHRRGGETDPAGDLGVADAGIRLQERQNLEVFFVHSPQYLHDFPTNRQYVEIYR